MCIEREIANCLDPFRLSCSGYQICNVHMPIFREFLHRTNHKATMSLMNFPWLFNRCEKRRRWLHRLESLVASKSGCSRKDSTYLGLVPEGLSDGHATRMKWNSGKLATSHGWEDEEPRLPGSIQDDRLIVAASMFGWQ